MRKRFGTWRAVLASALVAVFAATLSLSFAQDGGGAPAAPAAPTVYPEGVDGLKQLWGDLLKKAGDGDADGLKAMLDKMILTDADFAALLGDEKAKEVAPKYVDKVAKLWPGEAVNLIAKVKDRKYDEVEVSEATAAKDATGRDRKVLIALKEGTKMYSVRIKRKGEKTGTRYDSFFYVNGGWKAGTNALPKLLGGGDEKTDKAEKTDKGDKGEKKPAGEEK